MNKVKTVSEKMRQIAGWLYFALCAFQMFSLYAAWNTGFTGIYNSWLIELGLMLLYGVFAVWMISGRDTLRPRLRKAVVIATALIVVFALITHQSQLSMYQFLLEGIFPNFTTNVVWHVVFLIIRLVLLILAAFFVASSTEDADKAQGDAAEHEDVVNRDVTYEYVVEDADGEEVILEETIITEENEEEE